jgi:hypothetical protein
MAAGASPPVAEAVQFLMDPGVRQTPKEMQLGYLRDVLKLKPDQVIEAQRVVEGFQLQQTQQQLQAQQMEHQLARAQTQRATAAAEQPQQPQSQPQPQPQQQYTQQPQPQPQQAQQQYMQRQMHQAHQLQQTGPSAYSRSSDAVGAGMPGAFATAPQPSKLRAPGAAAGSGPPQFGGHIWGQQPQGAPRYRRVGDENERHGAPDDTAALLGAGGVFFDGRTTPSTMVEHAKAEVIANCDTRTYGRKKAPLMVQDDGEDMRKNGQTVMSAVLGAGGAFNDGVEDAKKNKIAIVTATGAVNTIEDNVRESSQIIEKNRRLAPRGQVAVERFGTDREIEAARKAAAQAAFAEQQAMQDAAAAAARKRQEEHDAMATGPSGYGDSEYAPSWNSAALSGEQPGPHSGLLALDGQGRRPRSRPTSDMRQRDKAAQTGGKPTDLRGGAVKDREKASFQNRVEADAVYQRMRSQQSSALW